MSSARKSKEKAEEITFADVEAVIDKTRDQTALSEISVKDGQANSNLNLDDSKHINVSNDDSAS